MERSAVNPAKLDKYLYIRKTPTWVVRGYYGFGIIAWLLVLYGYSSSFFIDPFFTWIVTPSLIFFTAYHLCTYSLACFYRRFNLSKHKNLIQTFWNNSAEPRVDVFLPICGEDLHVLHNTWQHVSQLTYRNKKVYVLDDSAHDREEHERMALQYGFIYFSRPNRGELKKAGNLKYGYTHSNSEFIVIFDADFAPHTDFIRELLPYMSDPKVGIVQSPQYFETTKQLHKRSPLEYGAAQVQEAFYRFIQPARDRFGGTICCGSNAIYRRGALDEIGGTVQIEHSEDAHTGFALTVRGWIVRYVPVILAIGICPDDAQAYFHQQHRWCMGSISLLSTKKFWRAPISWKTKFCYLCGLLFYINNPISLLFSFQLFWTLFFYNQYISFAAGFLYFPYMCWSFSYMLWFPIARFRLGCFYATFIQVYAYSHAIVSSISNHTVGWVPTNTKQHGVSRSFRQATAVAGIYVFTTITLIGVALHYKTLHFFNYNYYTIQFWIFWDIFFPSLVLWKLYKTIETSQRTALTNGNIGQRSFFMWQLKTAGLYILTLMTIFFLIVFL